MNGPLAGIRVLDISNVIAGPFAAALLGDFGAEVLKIELPATMDGKGGDALRALPPHKDGKPLLWKATNRNKKAITLDLRKPEGTALFKRLVPRFDVLIENYRPGTLDAWGLDKGTLHGLQPRLVILRVTGFGQDGPYRGYAGFARLFEAYSGLTYITRAPGDPPMHPGYPIGDPISGVFGAFGVLVTLLHQARNPGAPGQEIDLACTEAVMRLLEVLPIEYDQLGQVHEPVGNGSPYIAPGGMFRSADGEWLTFAAATQNVFERFCALIGRKDLVTDERFRTNPERMRHATELNAIVAQWIGERPWRDAVRELSEAGVAVAPVYSNRDIAGDPHFRARGTIARVKDEDFGSVAVPCVVPRLSATPGEARTAGPALGAHNAEVYGGWLGLSQAEQEALRGAGVI
jgi:crotonobetainyl-CoA:carnitine CoA-transferase CaiB-like acyl-CoA transferase